MTMPINGSISMNQANVELNSLGTTTRSLNDSSVRNLFGIPSGTISLGQGHGKSNVFIGTLNGNWSWIDLGTLAKSIGWNGTSKLDITLGAGSSIISNDVNTYALFVTGSFPNGVRFTNNGYIIGKGGTGGRGPAGRNGQAGGPAFSTDQAITIVNNGIIGGGGGGGGCGGTGDYYDWSGGGGGGAGYGGAGAHNPALSALPYVSAPGGAGTLTSPGGGGIGSASYSYGNDRFGWNGGSGGGLGAAGGGGPGWFGANGGGGAGGSAVAGNGFITWEKLGDVRGARA